MTVLTRYVKDIWLIDALGANIAAGFFGSLVTVFLVDRTTEKQQRDTEHRPALVAMRRSAPLLTQFLDLAVQMVKASSVARPAANPTSWKSLLHEDIAINADRFDISGPAPTMPAMTWANYFAGQIPRMKNDLTNIVDSFASVLPVNYVEAVERLLGSHYLTALCIAKSAALATPSSPGLRGTIGTGAERRDFFSRLRIALECQETFTHQNFRFPLVYLRNDMSPALGSSRLPDTATQPIVAFESDLPG